MNKEFLSLVKTSLAYKLLEKDIPENFSHSYLLVSRDKIALENLLTLICLRVYCPKLGCGSCPECEKVFSNNKTDLRQVNPDGESFKVEQVEGILEDASLSSFEGGEKVYIIRNLDQCSEVVQNKLLKTLEEPRPKVHFLITATSPKGVLQTVRSRTRQLDLAPFSADAIYNALKEKGYEDEGAKGASRCAGGSLDLAVKLLQDDRYFTLSSFVLDILEGLSLDSMPTFLSGSEFSQKEFPDTLDFFEMVFQDILKTRYGKGSLSFEKYKERYSHLAEKVEEKGCASALDSIAEARKRFKANCSVESVAHLLLMDILEVL